MLDDVRANAATVAASARFVRIQEDHLRTYAASLPLDAAQSPELDPATHYLGEPEATLAYLVLSPSITNPLLDDLVAAHVRSLMPSHLTDVVSTDRHTVKPWFAGHTDVSPVVADFAQQGYHLIGGRADYLDHQRSAVVVYQHGAHVINVFSWSASRGALPGNTTRGGYHLAFWKAGDLEYCAVSDTGWDELLGLARLLRDLSSRDDRE